MIKKIEFGATASSAWWICNHYNGNEVQIRHRTCTHTSVCKRERTKNDTLPSVIIAQRHPASLRSPIWYFISPSIHFSKYHITFVICQCNLNGSFIQSNAILNPCTPIGGSSHPSIRSSMGQRTRVLGLPIPHSHYDRCNLSRVRTDLHTSIAALISNFEQNDIWVEAGACMTCACGVHGLFHTHLRIQIQMHFVELMLQSQLNRWTQFHEQYYIYILSSISKSKIFFRKYAPLCCALVYYAVTRVSYGYLNASEKYRQHHALPHIYFEADNFLFHSLSLADVPFSIFAFLVDKFFIRIDFVFICALLLSSLQI